MSAHANLRALAALEYFQITIDRAELVELLAEVDSLCAEVERLCAPKAKPKKKAAALATDTLPDWLPLEAWNAFLDMRKKIKKPATEYAQKLLLKKLAAYHAHDLDPGAILNQSIMNGWQDLYATKEIGRDFGFGPAPTRHGRQPLADQNAANNREAMRLLDEANFDAARTINGCE